MAMYVLAYLYYHIKAVANLESVIWRKDLINLICLHTNPSQYIIKCHLMRQQIHRVF